MKRVFTNPWWGILLLLAIFWITIIWLSVKLTKKSIVNTSTKEQKTEVNKNERESSEKMHLSKDHYFSADYFFNASEKGKKTTTIGVIYVLYVLGNKNVINITTTAENVDGKIKNIGETVAFILEHQGEIVYKLIKAIVETDQKSSVPEPKKEKPPQPKNDKVIKKKV